MKTKDIIEGLTILQKYRDNQDGFNCDADRDVLYVAETDRPVEQPDLDRLIEMLWFQVDADCSDDGDFLAKHYDPDESWTCCI